ELNDVLGAATPYLRLFGQVVGGWFLAQSARTASGLAGDADPAEAAFYAQKVATARFYADNLLPLARGLVPAVTAGADELFAIEAAAL
ncbi:MAG: acyl-CoA dehydrogenase C-terminal domain-containing protein, partial [Nitriliruptorales bacterium]|nr:acyl-CoA dehydrogenase C-terminal domain-containing protein [Nitriliruptorales bacterium]